MARDMRPKPPATTFPAAPGADNLLARLLFVAIAVLLLG